MSLPTVPPLPELATTYQPFWVAMIIDGTVYDVLNIDGHSAAKYLSQPTFVQVDHGQAGIGWKYNAETGAFTQPPAA